MLIIPPILFRKRRGRSRQKASTGLINAILSVTVQSDGLTLDVVFTPGTTVTGVNNPDDNFYVNYSGVQTGAISATIIGPTHVRMTLTDMIDAPATWEVDDVDTFDFVMGMFAGPYGGEVVFA